MYFFVSEARFTAAFESRKRPRMKVKVMTVGGYLVGLKGWGWVDERKIPKTKKKTEARIEAELLDISPYLAKYIHVYIFIRTFTPPCVVYVTSPTVIRRGAFFSCFSPLFFSLLLFFLGLLYFFVHIPPNGVAVRSLALCSKGCALCAEVPYIDDPYPPKPLINAGIPSPGG